MSCIVGIDPGISGAIAIVDGCAIELYEMPILQNPNSKKNKKRVDGAGIANILRDKGISRVHLEVVHAMPGQGVTSMFNFGESNGIVIGVLQALGLPIFYVRPAAWKKKAGLIGTEKDAARALAIQRYPWLYNDLKRKKDGGKADAIFIASHIF